jgi:AbrB family looped-hinge helix DNA binding protein
MHGGTATHVEPCGHPGLLPPMRGASHEARNGSCCVLPGSGGSGSERRDPARYSPGADIPDARLTYRHAIVIFVTTIRTEHLPVANVVGERYQITIDKKVREQLGIEPGDQAVEWVEDGRLVIYFMPKPHSRSLLGILAKPGMRPITDWRAVKDAAWAARSAEIMETLRADSDRHRDPADR